MRRDVVGVALALSSAAWLVACPPPPDVPDAGTAPSREPDQACPGASGCEQGGAGQPLLVGAAKREVTPVGFEIAKPQYLRNDRPDYCEPGLPKGAAATTCGELKDSVLDDCGNDALCFGDEGYTGPDEDGSQGDGVPDYFWDCGRDRICPPPFDTPEEGELATNGIDDDGDGAVDEGPWTAPDADGSEGDGIFQGLWIAGYGNNRPAMGVKDPLWTRVVVLRQGDVTVALVTIDAVGLFYDETVRVRERLEEVRPGEVDLVMLQATHTHEAPDTLGQWGFSDPFAGLQLGHGRDEAHMERIRQGTVDAIVEALDGLSEAKALVGTINTRVDGFLHDGRDPKIFEDTLTAVRFARASDDSTITTLVHWGNHPEILDSRNNFISSDYLHQTRVALEAGLPATSRYDAHEGLGGIAIYQQGLVGGLMGPNGFLVTGREGTEYENRYKTFARCDAYGELLAEQAFQALSSSSEVTGELRFSRVVYRAPVENRVFHVGFLNGWFDRSLYAFDETLPIDDDNLPHLETEVAVVRFGSLAWVTAPGELFPEVWVGYDEAQSFGLPIIDEDNPNPPDLSKAPKGPYLKEIVGVDYPMLLGLAPDETGYMIPPYDFVLAPTGEYIDQADGDHYEETNSIGPKAVPLYLEHVGALIAFEKRRD